MYTPTLLAGLDQLGLPGAIARSISLLPEDLRGMFWANIGLVGGSTLFPGFVNRLARELRALAPPECEVGLVPSAAPITAAFHAGRAFARTPAFEAQLVTREEYMESGSSACRRKFKDWKAVAGRETEIQGKSKGKMRQRDGSVDGGSAIRRRPRNAGRG